MLLIKPYIYENKKAHLAFKKRVKSIVFLWKYNIINTCLQKGTRNFDAQGKL